MARDIKADILERRKTILIILTAVFFLISLLFDKNLSLLLNYSSVSSNLIYRPAYLLNKTATLIIVFISLALIFFLNRKKVLHAAAALVSAEVFGLAIKQLVGRERPFITGINAPIELIKSKYYAWDSSFPSLHAATSFALIPFMPKEIRIYWMVLAVAVSLTRVYFGLHYLSDVIFGAAIGLAVGILISRIKSRINKK